jgi:hypothetical protein
MTHGLVMNVPAPIEFYDAVHAEVGSRMSGPVEGLLCHVGRPTPTGFQVIEIWETREQYERYDAEIVAPTLAELAGDRPPSAAPSAEEFEPRGLVVPTADVFA